jgi:hypothetical protein
VLPHQAVQSVELSHVPNGMLRPNPTLEEALKAGDLIDYLEHKREALEMRDAEFAKHCGLVLSTWMRYKLRHRPPTLALMQRAINLWPAEEGDIVAASKRSDTRPGTKLGEVLAKSA